MALSVVTAYSPRHLVSVSARLGNSGNWTNIEGVVSLAYRPSTTLITDYRAINSTGVFNSGMSLYKPSGTPRGYGRSVGGILYIRNPEAVEMLVDNSHLNSNDNSTVNIASALQFQAKINTGLNTNNFRFVTKTFQPVSFGSGWGSSEFDWILSLKAADSGRRDSVPLPFRVMLNPDNTSFIATNSNTHGILTAFSNT